MNLIENEEVYIFLNKRDYKDYYPKHVLEFLLDIKPISGKIKKLNINNSYEGDPYWYQSAKHLVVSLDNKSYICSYWTSDYGEYLMLPKVEYLSYLGSYIKDKLLTLKSLCDEFSKLQDHHSIRDIISMFDDLSLQNNTLYSRSDNKIPTDELLQVGETVMIYRAFSCKKVDTLIQCLLKLTCSYGIVESRLDGENETIYTVRDIYQGKTIRDNNHIWKDKGYIFLRKKEYLMLVADRLSSIMVEIDEIKKEIDKYKEKYIDLYKEIFNKDIYMNMEMKKYLKIK